MAKLINRKCRRSRSFVFRNIPIVTKLPVATTNAVTQNNIVQKIFQCVKSIALLQTKALFLKWRINHWHHYMTTDFLLPLVLYLEFTIDFSARAVYRQGVFKRIESLGLFTRDDPTKRLPSTTLNPSKDGNFVGMRYASSKTPPRSLISNIYDASVRVWEGKTPDAVTSL